MPAPGGTLPGAAPVGRPQARGRLRLRARGRPSGDFGLDRPLG